MSSFPLVSRSHRVEATLKWLRLAAVLVLIAPTLPLLPSAAHAEPTCACERHGEEGVAQSTGGSCHMPAPAPSCHVVTPAAAPVGAVCHSSALGCDAPSDAPSFASGCGCHHGGSPKALFSVTYVVPQALTEFGAAPASPSFAVSSQRSSRASRPDAPPPRTFS